MGTPIPTSIAFEIKEQAPLVMEVTAQDGKKYDVKLAIMVGAVIDQGSINPLDGTPLLQIMSQIVTQVKIHGNG
jgi:hypothetical protein